MPTYIITAPDGKEYEVDAPEGASQDAALKYFQSNWKPEQKIAEQELAPESPGLLMKYGINPLKEIAGTVVEPIMQMGSGLVGSVAGNVAGTAAAARDYIAGDTEGDPEGFRRYIQEKFTYQPRTAGGKFVSENILAPVGGAIEYGAEAIADPLSMGSDVAKSGIKEALLQGVGFLGVKGVPKAGSKLQQMNAAKIAALKTEQAANRIKDATRIDGHRIGLIAPAESGIKRKLSHLGRAEPYISRKNTITATNALADDVGLPKGAISDVDMASRIQTLGVDYDNISKALPKQVSIPQGFKTQVQTKIDELTKQYAENPAVFEDNLPVIKNLEGQVKVDNLSPDILMQTVRRLRENSRNIEKRATKSIADENLAKTNYEVANLYEDIIEQSLQNKKALVDKFRDSRMKLSKLHLIDSARMSNGLVDPQKLGSVIGKYGNNKKFVNGKLKTVADFANQFKDVMKPVEESALPTITGWETAGALGGIAGASVNPASLAFAVPAAAKTFVPPLAMRGMLQTNPNYMLSGARRMLPSITSGVGIGTAFSPYIEEQQ